MLPKLFSQDNAVVCGKYYNISYMDTLNGKSIQFPQEFMDSIQKFNIISYYQSYPSINKTFLKSWITFVCSVEKAEEFANYLQTYESSVFSEVYFELPVDRRFDNVPYVPIDYYWDKSRVINTSYYQAVPLDFMWHLKIIQADYAWNITKGDPNIKIAIIDEGFNRYHPDLINKINFNDPFDNSDIIDTNVNAKSHGTRVACLAAGETDDNLGSIASVGFNSGIVAYNYPKLVQTWVEKAVHAAFNQNVKVINISFTGIGNPVTPTFIQPSWSENIKAILDHGVIIVRSAGNSVLEDGLFNRLPFSPVIDDRIIIVSATNFYDSHIDPTADPNHQIAATYCHYPEVTICAPGYSITTGSTMIPNNPPFTPYPGYIELWAGTSAATPIVSGVCALMKSINPDLTVREVKNIIQATADPIIDEYNYPGQLGAGRINAYKAVKVVDECYTIPILEKNISSNVTCSEPMRTSDTITIHNGAVLTINSTLKCAENVCIIVKSGGKLIIDGGTIKNGCIENKWQGIIVEGTPTQSQMGTAPNQGIVIVKNNAIIENAICGIKVGDTQDPTKNGGIIYASNAVFKNCKNAVLFAPYKNMNNNVELANRSKFTDCEFIVDDNFYTAGMFFDAHAKLLGVNGITFTGCSFSNAQTTSYPSARRYASSGILSFNSGFTVQPKCLSNLIPGETCDFNDIDVESRFTGLDYGIVAQGSDGFFKISVLSTNFESNDYGIYLSGVNNAKILKNSFVIGKNNNNLASNPVGLYILGGSGFRIEENVFQNNSNSTLDKIGIQVKNTGHENNQIYKNLFENLTYGQIFDGINYSTRDPYAGLISLCNENTDNVKYDFWVRKIFGFDFNGINQYQGILFDTGNTMNIISAGNKFSSTSIVDLQYNNDANFLYYLYNPNNPYEVLNSYTSASISREIASENPCLSKINGLNIQTIQSELTNITFNYGNLKYNYNQLIDAGNTPALIKLIQDEWSEDIWDLRTELLGQSPYLSQEAIMTVAEENLLPPALLLEICLANPDATKDEGFIEKLRCCIPTPLPEYMIDLIKASWDNKTMRTELEEQLSAFKTYRDEYQNYKIEFLLSDSITDYSQIKTHLETRGEYVDFLSLSEIAISQNDFQYATLYMDILENSIEKLTSEESTEVSSFKDYITIRESIFLSGKTIYNLDSTQIASLETYASSNNYRGAILARNILCFLYDICIEDVPATPKMLRIGSNGNNSQNSTPFIASVKVMPNPANEYASFIWNMKSFDKSAILYIHDQNGKIVTTHTIDTKQGQWVWNIKNVPNGVYIYTLKSEKLILNSGKIIVNK